MCKRESMFWKDFKRIGRWKTELRISDKSSAPKSTATCTKKPMFIESYIINQNYPKSWKPEINRRRNINSRQNRSKYKKALKQRIKTNPVHMIVEINAVNVKEVWIETYNNSVEANSYWNPWSNGRKKKPK